MEPKDRQTQLAARSQRRAYVLDHVVAGSLTLDQAAKVLGVPTRQVNRLLTRHADGPAALAHGNRGRPPANRIDAARRARLVELARTTYGGVNHAHLAELLAEREGIAVAERTLRRILAGPALPRSTAGGRRAIGAAATGCPGRACSSRSTAAATTGSRAGGRVSPWSAGSTTRPGS